MFREAFGGGTTLKFREETLSEDEEECHLQFQVLDAKAWARLLPRLVNALHAGEDYGGELRKAYYVSEEEGGKAPSVRYSWCVFFWATGRQGLEEAVGDLTPILGHVATPKAAPGRVTSGDPETRKKRARLVRKERDRRGNVRSTVVLPHAPVGRNDVPVGQRTTGLDDTRKVRARAEAFSGESGMPDAPTKGEL